ncbi:MAG: hypothetical protein FJ077_06280 [Cyanobacteria bacterium K_DeepCast_35m_m2_023]|nr:hypothetical protein [Cyanobacteria bacterium K_DeepCast_35m_m2_023]
MANPSRRLRPNRLAAVAALLLVLALAIGTVSQHQRLRMSQRNNLVTSRNEFVAVRDFAAAERGAGLSTIPPQSIRIGIEISNIYNLSLNDQTFMANGYYWLQWPEQVQQWMEQAEIEPEDLIEFTNNIVSYDFLVQPTTKKPTQLANGAREQSFRFSGHFWIESLDFKEFPFQTLQIPIYFEIKPELFSLSGDKPVALVANQRQSDMLGSLIEIPGLILRGGLMEAFVHHYADDDSIASGEQALNQSQVKVSALFSTHLLTSIGEWLMPIAIVMLTVFVAPSISGRLSDMRIAVPSAALLTLVVMQQSYETAIPALSYLTFLDLVYLWCYAVTAGLFMLFVWSANRLAEAECSPECDAARLAAVTARINRVDRRFQMASLIGSVILMLAALLR